MKGVTELKSCPLCGKDDICITEEFVLGFSRLTIIECRKCKIYVRRRTLKQAYKDWNTKTGIGAVLSYTPKRRAGNK